MRLEEKTGFKGYLDLLRKFGNVIVVRDANNTFLDVSKFDLSIVKTYNPNGFKKIKKDRNIPITTFLRDMHETIKQIAFVRVKSYELSTKVFGIGKAKKAMYESKELFKIHEILETFTCKKDKVARDVVEVCAPDGRNIKFVMSDLEFMYPNVEQLLKGFSPPKDREIRRGSNVFVIRKNKQKLPYKTLGVVQDFRKLGALTYAVIKTDKGVFNIDKHKLRVV
jgi:hypothetical protein